ncbi:MAG: GtrA family protein [Candidatus Neomarinimicrobiota bacterium]|tara:strand:+ start:2577 stop:2960 length:384 start_codon:yes stop_codon:yes gene_type:complete
MKFTKFLFVGLLGTITNISIFYVFVDRLFYPPIQISITGFILASIQNYIFHNNWTFLNESKKRSLSKTDYFKYLSVSVMSLVVNLSVLQFILVQYNPSIKAIGQLIGIASGTLINYLGAKKWVFREE